jgi:hypothetical protein
MGNNKAFLNQSFFYSRGEGSLPTYVEKGTGNKVVREMSFLVILFYGDKGNEVYEPFMKQNSPIALLTFSF